LKVTSTRRPVRFSASDAPHLLGRGGHRFLGDHVDAGLERPHDHLVMIRIAGADDHLVRLDGSNHVLRIGIDGRIDS
jgi:hypothetical protein